MADQLQPPTEEEVEMIINIKSDRCVELLEFVVGWYNLRLDTSEDVRQFLDILDKTSLEDFERKHFLGKELTKYPNKYSRLPAVIRKGFISHKDNEGDEDVEHECTCRKKNVENEETDGENTDENEDYSDEEDSLDEEDASEEGTPEVVHLSKEVMKSEDGSSSEVKKSNVISTSENDADNNLETSRADNANNLRKKVHMKAEIVIPDKFGRTPLLVTEHVSLTIKQPLKEPVAIKKTEKFLKVFSMDDLAPSDLMYLWKEAQPTAKGNNTKKNNKKNNKKKAKVETDDEFMDRFIKENEKLKQELIEEQFVKFARAGVPDEEKKPEPVVIPPKKEEQPADADYSNLIIQKIAELQEESLLDLMCKHKFNFGEVIVETARRGVMHFLEDVERVIEKGVTKENLCHRSLELFTKNFVMPNPDDSVEIRSERFENVHDFMWMRINFLDKDDSKYESVRLFVYVYLLEAMENKKECVVPTLERLMNAHGTEMFDLVEMELLHVVMGEFNGESECDSH